MSKIAMIGDKNIVSLFEVFGMDTFGVGQTEEAVKVIRRLKRDSEYSLVLINEAFALGLFDYINEINLAGGMYIMVIPDQTGKTEMSERILKRSSEKALGADMLFKE